MEQRQRAPQSRYGTTGMTARFTTIALAFLTLFGFQLVAAAADRGSADEAKAMAEKAAAQLATEGKEKAYVVFDNPSGPYVDRDLYVFVIDATGTVVAHPVNKALIGKSIINLKDASGRAFVQEMLDVVNTKGEGWVDYNWVNPTTKKVEPKSSFVKKVGDVLVGVGIYKG